VEIRRREPDVQIALRRFTSPWRVTRPRFEKLYNECEARVEQVQHLRTGLRHAVVTLRLRVDVVM